MIKKFKRFLGDKCQGGRCWGCGRGQAAGQGGSWQRERSPACPCLFLCDTWSGVGASWRRKSSPSTQLGWVWGPDGTPDWSLRKSRVQKQLQGYGCGLSLWCMGTAVGTEGTPQASDVWPEVASIRFPRGRSCYCCKRRQNRAKDVKHRKKLKSHGKFPLLFFSLSILKKKRSWGSGGLPQAFSLGCQLQTYHILSTNSLLCCGLV